MLLKAWARAVFRTRGLRRRNNSAAKPVGSGPQRGGTGGGRDPHGM